MLKGFINLPWWLRRRSEPKVYDVCCPQCGWRKTIELGKVSEDSRCIHGEEPVMEIRETLPENCPKCGGSKLTPLTGRDLTLKEILAT